MHGPATEPMALCPHSLVDPPEQKEGDSLAESPAKKTSPFQEITACLDGSEFGNRVVPHAQLVAQALGARLTLLRVLENVADSSGSPVDALDWEIRRQEARAHLEHLLEQVPEVEAGVHTELIEGRAAEQICGWVENHAVDLTVLCSHGSRGLTEWDLASTARKLIDRIPGALLLVPASSATALGQELRYRRILVPLDGSPRAESVLPVATRLAAAQAAELVLLHIVPRPELMRIGSLDTEDAELERQVIERNQRVAEVYLDRLRTRSIHAGVSVRVLVMRNGNVQDQLTRAIRKETPDIVVMSAHGQSGRQDCSCGSVTAYALTHAETPLLIVRDRLRPTRQVERIPTRSVSRAERQAHTAL